MRSEEIYVDDGLMRLLGKHPQGTATARISPWWPVGVSRDVCRLYRRAALVCYVFFMCNGGTLR